MPQTLVGVVSKIADPKKGIARTTGVYQGSGFTILNVRVHIVGIVLPGIWAYIRPIYRVIILYLSI